MNYIVIRKCLYRIHIIIWVYVNYVHRSGFLCSVFVLALIRTGDSIEIIMSAFCVRKPGVYCAETAVITSALKSESIMDSWFLSVQLLIPTWWHPRIIERFSAGGGRTILWRGVCGAWACHCGLGLIRPNIYGPTNEPENQMSQAALSLSWLEHYIG